MIHLTQDGSGAISFSKAPNRNPMSFDFDVDREGGFLGMEKVDNTTSNIYKAMGVD